MQQFCLLALVFYCLPWWPPEKKQHLIFLDSKENSQVLQSRRKPVTGVGKRKTSPGEHGGNDAGQLEKSRESYFWCIGT